MSSASVCLNSSGPEGEAVLGNASVDQIPKGNDFDARQSSVVGTFTRQQEESTSVIAEHGPKEGDNSIVGSFNETQVELLSGSSNLVMEDENTGDKNIDKKFKHAQ